MQKHKLLPLLFAAFFAHFSKAQPVLQNDIFPQPGDGWVIAQADPNGMTPGPAGANQNWDFSTLQTLYVEPANTVVTTTNTPGAADFPLANLCVIHPGVDNDTLYEYYRAGAGQFHFLGHSYYGILQQHTDPELLLQVPLAYGESFSDYFARYEFQPDNSLQGVGDKTVTYDGYGTLQTPAGTFSPVARLRTLTFLRDTFWLFAGYAVHTDTLESYQWYAPGRVVAQLSITHRKGVSTTYIQGQPGYTTPLPATTTVTFPAEQTTGAGQPGESWPGIAATSLWPNPANDMLHLQFSGPEAGRRLQLMLWESGGRALRTRSLEIRAGWNELTLPVADLPAGAYFLTLTDGRAARTLPWQKQ